MGRKIPSFDDLSISMHQTISLSLLVAGMAAAIAISTTLCGVRFRRRSPPSFTPTETLNISPPLATPTSWQSPAPAPVKLNIEKATHPAECQQQQQQQQRRRQQQQRQAVESEHVVTKDEEKKNESEPSADQIKQLPLPPSKQLKESISYKDLLTRKSASSRNLVKNMSMIKMPRSMSMARRDHENKDHIQKRKGKLKHEEYIWMKTIILGERCKVPEEDQEAVIYDSKGNRISTYHPKTPKSLPVSRQNSFIDPSTIPPLDKGD